MKRNYLSRYWLVLLLTTALTVKTYAQGITLMGPCMVFIEKDNAYVEFGYIAQDSVGNNISSLVIITGFVDETTPGIYHLYYDLPDSIAQIDSVIRTIIVQDQTNITGDSMNVTADVYTPDNVVSGYVDYLKTTLGLDATTVGTVDYQKVGIYPVSLSIANPLDPNCVQTVHLMVNVVDRIAPIIVLMGPDPLVTCTYIPYLEPGYLVADNYWSTDDIKVSMFADFKLDSLFPHPGQYTIKYVAMDSSGNVSDTMRREIYVQICDGINEMAPASPFNIFPNPSSERFSISQQNSSEPIVSLSVYDVTGKEVKSLKMDSNQHEPEVKVNDLRNGIYLLQIKTEQHTYSKKFQVVH